MRGDFFLLHFMNANESLLSCQKDALIIANMTIKQDSYKRILYK